jgi:hypothetical protein
MHESSKEVYQCHLKRVPLSTPDMEHRICDTGYGTVNMGDYLRACLGVHLNVLARVYPMCEGIDCGLLLLEKNKKLWQIYNI